MGSWIGGSDECRRSRRRDALRRADRRPSRRGPARGGTRNYLRSWRIHDPLVGGGPRYRAIVAADPFWLLLRALSLASFADPTVIQTFLPSRECVADVPPQVRVHNRDVRDPPMLIWLSGLIDDGASRGAITVWAMNPGDALDSAMIFVDASEKSAAAKAARRGGSSRRRCRCRDSNLWNWPPR